MAWQNRKKDARAKERKIKNLMNIHYYYYMLSEWQSKQSKAQWIQSIYEYVVNEENQWNPVDGIEWRKTKTKNQQWQVREKDFPSSSSSQS